MANVKFNRQWNPREKSRNDKEVNNLPSMTVPDQSMSIKEIMRRHAHGLPTVGQKVPFYDEESDLPDHRTLDLSEIEDIKNEYVEKVEKINQKKAEAMEAAAERKRQKEIDDEIAKRKKEEEKKSDEKSTNIP